ncbi:MAG: WG repeat-containing protein [Muribaculaceae bacterium]|nr:WG repeat-containing protein [Muribaculaceae bacterium]
MDEDKIYPEKDTIDIDDTDSSNVIESNRDESDSVLQFYNDVAFVEVDGKYGLINRGGEYIIEPKFEEVLPQLGTGDDLYFEMVDFLDGNAIVKYDGKWGLIDTSGEWLANPVYDRIGQFFNGFANVYKNGTGFIDKNGNEVIKPTHDLSWDYPHYLVVYEPIYKKYGVIYTDGEWVIKPEIPREIIPIKKI